MDAIRWLLIERSALPTTPSLTRVDGGEGDAIAMPAPESRWSQSHFTRGFIVVWRTMHIAILTFEGFNELDSLIAFNILNRVKSPGWRVSIAAPAARVRSMNGVLLESQATLEDAATADAVLVGSGIQTRDVVADAALMDRLRLDPSRQLVGAQCSGTLVLARLGLLNGLPACTDLTTKPWVQEAGVRVLEQPFVAQGNVATAGGCLASQYLATWVVARLEGVDAARRAVHYVAPVGEKDQYVERALAHVAPFLPDGRSGSA